MLGPLTARISQQLLVNTSDVSSPSNPDLWEFFTAHMRTPQAVAVPVRAVLLVPHERHAPDDGAPAVKAPQL